MSVSQSLSNRESSARVFRPAQLRSRAAWVLVGLTALGGIPSAFLNDGGPVLFWLRALGWIFVLPIPLYAGAMARRVTIEPGAAIRFRTPLFRARNVPIDATTEIVHFTAVGGYRPEGAGRKKKPKKIKGSPIRVIDQKWAVVRSQGRTVLRLSMWNWSDGQLLEMAMAAPAQLRIRPESMLVTDVQAQYSDYYSWIERHPALEGWVLAISLLLSCVAILAGAGSLLTLAATLWPAPR